MPRLGPIQLPTAVLISEEIIFYFIFPPKTFARDCISTFNPSSASLCTVYSNDRSVSCCLTQAPTAPRQWRRMWPRTREPWSSSTRISKTSWRSAYWSWRSSASEKPWVFMGTQFKKHNVDKAAFKIKRTQNVPTSESQGNSNNVASRLTQSQTVQMLLTQFNKLWRLDVSHDSAPVVRR